MRYASWALIVVLALIYTAAIFTVIFSCKPIRKFWYPDIQGTCIDLYPRTTAPALVNIITDILVLLLPILPVWKLQMPRKQKMFLFGVFAVGTL